MQKNRVFVGIIIVTLDSILIIDLTISENSTLMNTKKISKYHHKLNKHFTEILSEGKKTEEKIKIYNKQLKIIEKLRIIESKGKIKYETPLSEVAEEIEKDKNTLEQKLKKI